MSNPLNEVLTLAEASHLWRIAPDTLRHAIHRNKFAEGEIRKTNSPKGDWLILRSAIIRLYGEAK